MYEIYLSIVAFLLGAFAMFTFIAISASLKEDKTNKVHFYITRDRCGLLELWLGVPYKLNKYYLSNSPTTKLLKYGDSISEFGLKLSDYDNLTFDDKPVEVFLNLED